MQTKRQTVIEITANTIVGFVGSFIITYLILHRGLSAEVAAISVTVACTIWSIVRQYFIRRYFNRVAIRNLKHDIRSPQ